MKLIRQAKHNNLLLLLFLTLTFYSVGSQSGPGFCVNLTQINNDYFEESIGMVWHPTREKWLVWEKKGDIYLLNPANGVSAKIASLTKDIDLRGDGGLLSMAIHPQYPDKPFIFISRTIIYENARMLVLEKYILDNYDIIERTKRVLLRTVIVGTDNTAGYLAFDLLGNLLFSIGDGRNEESTIPTSATNPETLPGSLLRLDVDSHHSKALPAQNNPFSELLDGAVENYAYGFKNPNRVTVDSLTGDIWLSDSGRKTAGEINFILPKFFYGWACRDGVKATRAMSTIECREATSLESFPTFEYSTRVGVQAIGGYIYRGRKNENWYGRYFFADYGNGAIWSAVPRDNRRFAALTLAYNGQQIIPMSFAQDHKKELFLVDYQGRTFSMHDRECQVPQKILTK